MPKFKPRRMGNKKATCPRNPRRSRTQRVSGSARRSTELNGACSTALEIDLNPGALAFYTHAVRSGQYKTVASNYFVWDTRSNKTLAKAVNIESNFLRSAFGGSLSLTNEDPFSLDFKVPLDRAPTSKFCWIVKICPRPDIRLRACRAIKNCDPNRPRFPQGQRPFVGAVHNLSALYSNGAGI